MKDLFYQLSRQHYITTPYCAWSNLVERTIKELRSLFKMVMMELKLDQDRWTEIVPFIQYCFNQKPTLSLFNKAPMTIFIGRELDDLVPPVFTKSNNQLLSTGSISIDLVMEHIKNIHDNLKLNSENILEIQKRKLTQNHKSRKASLQRFEIGDYVLWSKVDRKTAVGKLYCIWKGPLQIIDTKSDYVYVIQDLLTKKIFPVHVSRLVFFSSNSLNVTSELKEFISKQGKELGIREIVKVEFNPSIQDFQFEVAWEGLENYENSNEKFASFFSQVPVLVCNFMENLFKWDPIMIEKVLALHGELITQECTKRKLVYSFLKEVV